MYWSQNVPDVSVLDEVRVSHLSLVVVALAVEHCPELGQLVGREEQGLAVET